MSEEDESILVMLVQRGDIAAFEKLLRRLHTPLRRYVTNMVGQSTADDVLQEVSWQIFRQMLLHYQQHLSLEETAAILDLPLGTVKSRLSYGVATIRQFIKEEKNK